MNGYLACHTNVNNHTVDPELVVDFNPPREEKTCFKGIPIKLVQGVGSLCPFTLCACVYSINYLDVTSHHRAHAHPG